MLANWLWLSNTGTLPAFGFINLFPPGPTGVTAKLYTVLHDYSGFTNTLVLVATLHVHRYVDTCSSNISFLNCGH